MNTDKKTKTPKQGNACGIASRPTKVPGIVTDGCCGIRAK